MADPPIACYARGTSPELVARDIQSCLRFCKEHLDKDWISPGITKRAIEDMDNSEDNPIVLQPNAAGYNTNIIILYDIGEIRDGVRTLLDGLAENNDIHDELVVATAGRLVDNDHNLDLIKVIVGEFGVSLHFCEQGVTLHSLTDISDAVLQTLSLMSDLTVNDGVDAIQTHDGGRPPLGFTSENSRLRPDEDYNNVCTVLQQVKDGEMSKRKAADVIGCERQTIRSALRERPRLYNIE